VESGEMILDAENLLEPSCDVLIPTVVTEIEV
jgi:hypothetical protein